MTQYRTDDLRINRITEVRPPIEILNAHPITDKAGETVYNTRKNIHQVLAGKDDRLLVVIGPCSIHDVKAGMEYAERLQAQIAKHQNELLIVMRVYFEKPRTTVGWKGLINDPDLNETFDINKGLETARGFLLDVNNLGVPAATEFLDLISPQYFSDLISWGAIGARTTESQGHRELASGLSCPVGFKNGTDGGVRVAVDAIGASQKPHIFLSLTKTGNSAIFSTTGNADCHIILRGGNDGPNYEPVFVEQAVSALKKAGVQHRLMIDCSHANSNKNHELQMKVAQSIHDQLTTGTDAIMGVMVESHLVAGRQDAETGKELVYGQSITDACIGWDDTEVLLDLLAKGVKARRASKA